jgi:predicted ATPase/class 3 adenylate cyclase
MRINMKIAAYHIETCIAESEHFLVYVAKKEDGPLVLLKSTRREDTSRLGERMLRNEFDITNQFEAAFRPIEIIRWEGVTVLARPHVAGQTLRQWMAERPRTLGECLQVLIHICHNLTRLYQYSIIHKDLKPDNIIVGPDGQSTTIIDYALATQLSLKKQYLGNPERMEGNLAYIAPEQTGRMNRVVDYRCDFYSVGVILYELLTGQQPFRSDKPIEVLYGLLAKSPVPPTALRPDLPPILDQICLKLLQKNAEDRYQSAERLRDDLENCLRQWSKNQHVTAFSIAQNDLPLRFKLPAKLYGREREHATLLGTFDKVARGQKMLVCIGGYSGIGKTALVNDLQIDISSKNGFFVTGKFEQYQRNIPYFAWKQGLEKWVEWLLTGSQQYIAGWRKLLHDSMGDLLGVLTDLVPGLEKVIGQQPAPLELSASENQNRFHFVARTFLKTVCTKEHPLVFFLDDLQWADPASLNLLRVVMTEPGLGYFLLICAYRDNETEADHPFLRVIDTVQKDWKALNDLDTGKTYAADQVLVHTLSLPNLQERDLRRLIEDAVSFLPGQAEALSQLVYAKTQGNAYFAHRLVESLYQEGAIRIVHNNGQAHWHFDAEQGKHFGFSDNVVTLLERKVEQLSHQTQELLRKAASIGLQFDLQTLSIIARLLPGQAVIRLREALQEELILPIGSEDGLFLVDNENLGQFKYQFSHDRVRQAVYARIPLPERQSLHLQAGQLLLQTLQNHDQDERIFEIVNHLNEAGELNADRLQLAQLNYRAGIRAISATAYTPAYEYLRRAITFLPDDPWQSQYDLTLKITNASAEAAALAGDYDAMDPLIEEIMRHAKTPFEKVGALEIRTNSLFLRQKINESVVSGFEALALLNVKMPKKVTQAALIAELVRTNWALRSKTTRQLLDQPLMTDPAVLSAVRIMSKLGPGVFFVDPQLFLWLNLRMTRLNARYGNSLTAAYAYANYAFVISLVLKQYTRGAAFGQLALDLMYKYKDSKNMARTHFVVHFFVEHWTRHSATTLEPLKNAYHLSLASGEADFTAFLGNAYAQNALLNSLDLGELETEIKQQAAYMQQNSQVLAGAFNAIYLQFVYCLTGKASNPRVLMGDAYDSSVLREEVAGVMVNQNYYQLQLSLIFGEYETALQSVDLVRKSHEQIRPVPIGKTIFFLDTITAYHTARLHPEHTKQYIRRIRRNIGLLQGYNKNCPDEFAGKTAMAQGYLLALEGQVGAAMSKFQDAELSLKKEGNFCEQGLAFLEIYRFHDALLHEDLSRLYLQKALKAFQHWGALGVVSYLEQLRDGRSASAGTRKPDDSSGNRSGGIDVYSLAQGARVITGELDLPQLSVKMLNVMAENAGATHGMFVLERNGQYQIMALLNAESQAVAPRETLWTRDYAQTATTVLNYVIQSGQNVVLDDAHATGRFMNDAHIRTNRIRSVLCMNLMHQNKSSGILYLENNLAPGTFMDQRIEVLNILGAQAAISLENAKYYEQIQSLNRAYERFVPQDFLHLLNKSSVIDIARGDQSVRTMAVMFSDIWGFTALCEKLPAAEVFTLLNDIWALLTPIIQRHNGIVDKYIGDAVMALFPQRPIDALHAAVDMQSALQQFSQQRAEQFQLPIQMGIGLHYGPMILGTVGSDTRLDTTVIGDAVNVAARLEPLTRQYRSGIIVSADMAALTKDTPGFHLRPIGSMFLRGRTIQISLYEDFSNDPAPLRAAKLAEQPLFEQFLQAHKANDEPLAQSLLRQYRNLVPGDLVAGYYD